MIVMTADEKRFEHFKANKIVIQIFEWNSFAKTKRFLHLLLYFSGMLATCIVLV